MSKTCETCKWFWKSPTGEFQNRGLCEFESSKRATSLEYRCSKWESKLERKCGNCEFFVEDEDRPESDHGSCRVRMHAGLNLGTIWRVEFPITDKLMWCGEFRGRE